MLWNKMLETASTGKMHFEHPGGGRFLREQCDSPFQEQLRAR